MSACFKDTARNTIWTCGFADIHVPERSGSDQKSRPLGELCVGEEPLTSKRVYKALSSSDSEVEVYVAGCLRSL